MSTVINSKEEPLPAPTVILTAMRNLGTKDVPPEAAMLGVAEELNMEGTDMVQIGNTVFIGHRGKGKNKDLVYGRAINIDTAQNFFAAGLKYFDYLQKKGVRRYVTDYDGDVYDKAFMMWNRSAKRSGADTNIAVGRKADGGSRAFITIGSTPLPTKYEAVTPDLLNAEIE